MTAAVAGFSSAAWPEFGPPYTRPPEDVGGVHGYANFLDIIADPDNPEYRDTKRWVGGHFDPEWFDREMTEGRPQCPQGQPPHPPPPAPSFLIGADPLPKLSLHRSTAPLP